MTLDEFESGFTEESVTAMKYIGVRAVCMSIQDVEMVLKLIKLARATHKLMGVKVNPDASDYWAAEVREELKEVFGDG